MSDDPVRLAYRMQLNPDAGAGAVVMADLARRCHAGETTFVPDDPQLSAFREGRRSVFLEIAAMIAPPAPPTRQE